MTAGGPGVAAFDFDGTLTRRDTLFGFVATAAGPLRLAATALRAGPSMVRGALDDDHRDSAKEQAVGTALRGRTIDQLRQTGERYAATLPRRYREDTLLALREHQRRGHFTVIVSASLVYYLEPAAAALGIDAVIGVSLDADSSGRVTGRLNGANVRAEEKVRRLEALLSERFGDAHSVELWAYGNSQGDAALLDRADHATWVA